MLAYPRLSSLTNEVHVCIVKCLFENLRQCLMYVEKEMYSREWSPFKYHPLTSQTWPEFLRLYFVCSGAVYSGMDPNVVVKAYHDGIEKGFDRLASYLFRCDKLTQNNKHPLNGIYYIN